MRPLLVVVGEVPTQPVARLPRRSILAQIDLLVLDRPPQAFDEDVVQGPAFAIHTDLDLGIQQQLGVLWAREVAPLIAVPDRRRAWANARVPASSTKGISSVSS